MSEENPPQPDQQAPNVSDKPQEDLLITPRETHFHNVFVKYLIMLISALGSVIYTTVLCTGSILNHWFDIVRGRKRPYLQISSKEVTDMCLENHTMNCRK